MSFHILPNPVKYSEQPRKTYFQDMDSHSLETNFYNSSKDLSVKSQPSNIPTRSHKVSSLQKFDTLSIRDTPEKPSRLPSLHRQNTTEKVLTDAQITPPSSPGGGTRRARHSFIARLSKMQTTQESSGKANQELSEFDPLMSPIKMDDATDPLVSYINSQVKAESQPDKNPPSNSSSSNSSISTRLPIPINKNTSMSNKGKSKESNNENNQSVSTTKLRIPEVFASKSVKSLSTRSDQGVPYREKSMKASASLVSARGLISQPDKEDIVSHSSVPNRAIHNTLQHFVEEEKMEHKREKGTIEVVSPKMALYRFKPFLSPYEQTEILKYHSVYCVGSYAKKNWAATDQPSSNYGYDDENGDYKIVMRDHLNYRYEIIESLGKGSFGQVVKCRDMKAQTKDVSNEIVAVKIIRNKKRYHAQALTEVKILEKLMQLDPHNKNFIVRVLDNFYFREHLCIVFECLSMNLFEIIQQNSYQGFSMGLVKRFAHQILTALKLLGEHNIIHCDLKPENILLKKPDKSGIRLIDLGSSCLVNEKVYSYIQSRFYRAPEVILGLEYGLPIDMWSTGCILAELYTGRPLFPGESELDQLGCIMQLLGEPSIYYLSRCTRKKHFFDRYDSPRKSTSVKKRRPNSLTFTEALKRSNYDTFDRDFGDFMSKCLTWEPSERMTADQALNHPWMKYTKR